MVKVRKMLGDVNSPECLAMMRLIETQSEVTLARWALSYVREHVLPIYMEKKRRRSVMNYCPGMSNGS